MAAPVDANFWLDLLKNQGVSLMLVLWFIWMVSFRVWPFYTNIYLPKLDTERKDLTANMASVASALIEVNTNLELLNRRTEYIEEALRSQLLEQKKARNTRTRSAAKPKASKEKAA